MTRVFIDDVEQDLGEIYDWVYGDSRLYLYVTKLSPMFRELEESHKEVSISVNSILFDGCIINPISSKYRNERTWYMIPILVSG